MRTLKLITSALLGLLAALALAFAPRTRAESLRLPSAPLVVTTLNDSGPGSLRQAILDANPGDSIGFAPNITGVLALTSGPLDITKSLTISGPGASLLTISGTLTIYSGTVNISRLTFRTDGFDHVINNLGTLTFDHGVTMGGLTGIGNSGILTVTRSAIISGTSLSAINRPLAPCLPGFGIFNDGNAVIVDSVIANNVGHAIGNYAGSVFLTNVTVSGNQKPLLNGWPGPGPCGPVQIGIMTVTNSTIADAMMDVSGSTLFLGNSLVGGTCDGAFSSLGHNLTSDASCVFTATGDITATNLMLAPLGDYGGPTLTRMPLPGSPAIDAGNPADCPANDQRSIARPIDGNGDTIATCDIGAVEFNLTSTMRLPFVFR